MINKYILNSVTILTGKYVVSPTGITTYSIAFTTPLNIPSGYVAKFTISEFPVSAIISAFCIQKLILASITAIHVNTKPPHIENNVNNIKLNGVAPYKNSITYAYNISPKAEIDTLDVIDASNTFLG